MITPAEVADALGVDGTEPERTFTDNDSDSCEWSAPGSGQLSLSFAKSEPTDVPPDPDSTRLTNLLGRQAIVLRTGATSCNVSVPFAENRWLLFTLEPAEGKRTPADPSAATGCDEDVPLVKTIIDRLDWK